MSDKTEFMADLAEIVRDEMGMELSDVEIDDRLLRRAVRDDISPRQFFEDCVEARPRDIESVDDGFDPRVEGISI